MEPNLALQRPPETGNIKLAVKQAMQEPKINNVPVDHIKQILRYIFGLIGLSGDKFPDEGEKVIIIDYIKKEMARYSLMDLKLAFTLYVQQKLDYRDAHYSKFSVLFLENVIQSYQRYRVSLNIFQKTELPQPEPTPDEIEEIHKQSTLLKFNNYIKTGIISDPGNASYNWLDKNGFIKFSVERKKIIFQQAQTEIIKEKSKQLQCEILGEGYKLKSIKNEIAEIREGGDPAVIAAKKLALKEYFNDIIEIGTTLQENINE